MTRHWTRFLATGVIGLLIAAAPWAAPGSLVGVDADVDGQGRPVITLTTDQIVPYESFVLDGPDRLVLDLPGTIHRAPRSRFDIGQGGVARVRAAQHTSEPLAVTRVVIDLESALAYRIDQQGQRISIAFGEGEGFARQPVTETLESIASAAELDTDTAAVDVVASNAAVADSFVAPVEAAAVEIVVDEPQAGSNEPTSLAELLLELETRDAAAAADDGAPEPAVEGTRAIGANIIEQLLSEPRFAAPAPQSEDRFGAVPQSFESRTILTDEVVYNGRRISLNLVDADIKQVFRLFHEISGLNFVLDPGVSGRVTIVLDQVPWDQALDIILKNNSLDKVLENNVLRIASTQKLAQEAAARRQLRDAQELEVEPITLTRTLSYARAEEVQRVIQNGGILSPRGSVIVDERTNTLIISDVPKKAEPVDKLIDTLDAETPQVMIEARIVETSRQFVRDMGVSWGFRAAADAAHGTSTGLGFPRNASVAYGLNLPRGQASTLAFSLGNIVDSFTLDLALNALEQEGQGRILSSPKVATQNNERAEIEQGVRIPIVNTTATEINVEFVSASLRLIVTPQITAEGTIVLDVEVENNSPDFVNTSGDIPSIRTQRAQTKVLINDGGTTVIGGIFTVNEGKSEVGVPWFRKIPGLGWLFKSQNISTENRELLIFITPKIVKLS